MLSFLRQMFMMHVCVWGGGEGGGSFVLFSAIEHI